MAPVDDTTVPGPNPSQPRRLWASNTAQTPVEQHVECDAVSNATPPPPHRRLDIQGLRAIAIGVVVCFHAGLPVPGGFIGVDIFFVISGFVITGMLAREHATTGSISVRTFYVRRFRRLTPALALTVAVVAVVSALVQSPMGAQQVTAETGIGAMLLIANLVVSSTTGGYFDAPAAANPLLHTWSLSVEEQFYLIFPALLLLAWSATRRRGGGHSIALLMLTGVGALSLAITLAEAAGHRIPFMPAILGGFYGPVTRVWEFAAGAALALVAERVARHLNELRAAVIAAAGLAGIAMSLWLVNGDTAWPGPLTMLPVASTMALLLAGLLVNPLSQLLGSRPFVAIGDISYSWYLWHWPFIVFALLIWPHVPAVLVIAATLSLAPALASYRWVEQPIRRLRAVGSRKMARIVVVSLATPITVSLALLVAANNSFWIPSVQHFVATVAPMHAGNAAGCNKSIAPSDRRPTACRWNENGVNKPVYLVGDSHADHLSEALINSSLALGRPLTIATSNSCPFYDVVIVSSAQPRSTCTTFVQRTTQWLLDQPAGTVVIGASSIYWNSDTFAVGPDAASQTRDRASKSNYLTAGLESTVKQLQEAGHQVILVQDVPFFAPPYNSDPQQFSVSDIASGRDLAMRMPLDLANSRQRAPRAGVEQVAADTGATVLDLRDYFCPMSLCTTELDGTYLYRDEGHISIAASEALTGRFTAALSSPG